MNLTKAYISLLGHPWPQALLSTRSWASLLRLQHTHDRFQHALLVLHLLLLLPHLLLQNYDIKL